jgi:hypothetical protein
MSAIADLKGKKTCKNSIEYFLKSLTDLRALRKLAARYFGSAAQEA